MKRLLSFLLIALVRFYQYSISPLFPPSCRYTPTCSQYAIEAIRKQRAEAQQKQQAMEQLANAAPAANQATQAAKNLSEAVGGGREAVADWLGVGN